MRIVTLALCLLGLPALAEPAPATFLQQAAADTIADVEAGRLVQTAAGIPDSVRQLSRDISGEAKQLNERLVKLAGPRAVALANQIPAEDRRALEQLNRLQGAEFTRTYLRYVVADLDHDQALYQAATTLDDPALAQFAREALPQLRNQLMVARAVQDAQVATVPR